MPPRSRATTRARTTISLYARGRRPSTSTRSSFSRIACHTRPGDDSTDQRTMKKTTREVPEREPVQVLRVEDADERIGQLRVVDAEPLLAVRPVMRILVHEHRPRLREGERHHRERDAAHAKRDRAEHERHDEAEQRREEHCLREAPVPVGDRDVRHVRADRDVERVPERQQPREAEEEVVREREPAEEQAEREQLQRPGARDRAVEQLRDRPSRSSARTRARRRRRAARRSPRRRACSRRERSGKAARAHEQHRREQQEHGSADPCRRSSSSRSSSRTAARSPTTTAAIAEPPIEPRPPITTTMNAKISRLVPWFGSIVVK